MRNPGLPAAMAILVWCQFASALDLSQNPERSVFFGVDLGAGLDMGKGARHPVDLRGESPEAYAISGFLFSIQGGYRFNEIVGFDTGWRQIRHNADEGWGGIASYSIWHIALRLAIPTPSRQTIVFELGPAIGGFHYGAVAGKEENDAFVLGGLGGVILEHELGLAVVGYIKVNYVPAYRFGQDDRLLLEEEWFDAEGTRYVDELDSKDFTDGRLVHLLWMTVGIQFEWVLR
jgi:hypothetical protein